MTLSFATERPTTTNTYDLSTRIHIKDVDYASKLGLAPAPPYSLIMRDVIYENCNFEGTSFYTSELTNVTFASCNFRHASLNLTSFYHSNFVDCDMFGADLFGLEMHYSDFVNTPLDDVKLFGSFVRRSLILPAGYTVDAKHNAPLDPALVIYDPLWLDTLPAATGASAEQVAFFLLEHPSQTPRTIIAMLRAVHSRPASS